jgi:predicted DsbA family dithiol-disulfide isomerase
VLESLATDIGLNNAEFRVALESHAYSDRVETLLRHAYRDLGITGVPFFLIGARSLTGLQSRETLARAIDEAAG